MTPIAPVRVDVECAEHGRRKVRVLDVLHGVVPACCHLR